MYSGQGARASPPDYWEAQRGLQRGVHAINMLIGEAAVATSTLDAIAGELTCFQGINLDGGDLYTYSKGGGYEVEVVLTALERAPGVSVETRASSILDLESEPGKQILGYIVCRAPRGAWGQCGHYVARKYHDPEKIQS